MGAELASRRTRADASCLIAGTTARQVGALPPI